MVKDVPLSVESGFVQLHGLAVHHGAGCAKRSQTNTNSPAPRPKAPVLHRPRLEDETSLAPI